MTSTSFNAAAQQFSKNIFLFDDWNLSRRAPTFFIAD
jgi:hypothetical protein